MQKRGIFILLLAFISTMVFSCTNDHVASSVKETEVLTPLPSKTFNVIRLPLGTKPLPKKDSKVLLKLQKQLWEKQIPLNPGTFNRMPKDIEDGNKLDEEAWQKFLLELPLSQGYSLNKMMKGRDYITYAELEFALGAVVTKFSELVRDDYSIGLNLRKSSHWIASLLVPHLSKMPVSAFEPAIDTVFNGGQSHEFLKDVKDIKTSHFVLFDDASYSGSQLSVLLRPLIENPNSRITLFIPFCSDYAINYIKTTHELEAAKNNVIITIVTTDRKLKALSTVLTKVELYQANILRMTRSQHDYEKLSLTHTAWKTPDGVSFPDVLVVATLSNLKKSLGQIGGFGFFTANCGEELVQDGEIYDETDNYSPARCFLPQKIAPYKKHNSYDWDTEPLIE